MTAPGAGLLWATGPLLRQPTDPDVVDLDAVLAERVDEEVTP